MLKSKAEDALNHAANRVKQIIDEHIQTYYNNYTPKRYKRTYQFLNSCVKTDVEWHGNTAQVVVYIDFSKMKHDPSVSKLAYKTATGLDVVNWANQGLHGGLNVGDDHKFWDESIDEIDALKIMYEIADRIRQSGIKVKIL